MLQSVSLKTKGQKSKAVKKYAYVKKVKKKKGRNKNSSHSRIPHKRKRAFSVNMRLFFENVFGWLNLKMEFLWSSEKCVFLFVFF